MEPKAKSLINHDLITPPQAAAKLGLSVQTLAIWRSTNRQKLPFVKIGNRVRYRLADIERFVTDRLLGQHAAIPA